MKKIVWNVREWRSCDSLEFTLLKINIPALTFSVISNKLLSTSSQQTPWEKIAVVTFDLDSNYFLRFWKNRPGVCGHFWRSVHQRPFKSCPTAFNLKMSVDRRMGCKHFPSPALGLGNRMIGWFGPFSGYWWALLWFLQTEWGIFFFFFFFKSSLWAKWATPG